MMMGGRRDFSVVAVVCFLVVVQLQQLDAQRVGHGTREKVTCQDVCHGQGVDNGCQYALRDGEPREEVIVITDGTSDITSWKWDTVTMVVSSYFASTARTGYTACYAHSIGKRYGLRERVPYDISSLLSNVTKVKMEFTDTIILYQQLLMADHVVFDLLNFFVEVASKSEEERSQAMSSMNEILTYAAGKVKEHHNREVYCVVPWEPPCDSDCQAMRTLLASCEVLLMSPDSYTPMAPVGGGECLAQATVPISKFLYGVDRYIALKAQPDVEKSIVAGIPWHGFAYKCGRQISDGKCYISRSDGQPCFDHTNRRRLSLGKIHSSNIVGADVKMDQMSKGIYYNLNSTGQLWFENYTTLLIKYQLVQDLQLKGLSIWNGEDLAMGLSGSKAAFSVHSWDFLTHHVLHRAAFRPLVQPSHFYADTVAGISVGCLILGVVLGVTFTCIAYRHGNFNKRNRPFKLDEDEDGFRDDEGL